MDASRVTIWGGIECTVARIRDRIVDQTRLTGHHDRPGDLDLIAGLGIRTLRYPVLWERCFDDWSWTDERLGRLRELGIEPIATLLHHGSGPLDTHLLDPEFPAKFARFAASVAQRYPWLRKFTPVNEPLTTARFSALYGLWYPHATDDASFATALLNQTEATARAMEAIREIIPDAQLVQTEDLGKTHSTPHLAYQARHENDRRWASLDLLTGRFNENRICAYFYNKGVDVSDRRLAQSYCPPDILGFNYYVTTERWIDERVELYAGVAVGGNGRDAYIDVEAVRSPEAKLEGIEGLGWEAWQRFRLPIAITEAHHLAEDSDDQVRWLDELYAQTVHLKARGADVRAFTVWSLLGAYDWNSLLTVKADFYESGCFDVSRGMPRATPIERWVKLHARDGWWRHEQRYIKKSRQMLTGG